MANTLRNEYQPDIVSPPGETLREVLTTIGMTQAELAERVGRPKKTISEIINGKTAITPETALQLERVLAISAGFWLRREQHYRESLARQQDEDDLATHLEWLKEFPVKEMIAKGWISGFRDKIDQLKEVLRFFAINSPDQWDAANFSASFRRSNAYQANPASVAAWLRAGELAAQDIYCQRFNAETFREALTQARRLTVEEPEVFVSRLQEICGDAGVAVVFIPELKKTRASGATRWLTSEKALIQLSLRYKTNDHFWFTFFHEAGHILLHGKREVFLEEADNSTASLKEQQANQFAADFLIPPREMTRLRELVPRDGLYPSLESIEDFAREIGIAPGIVVGRLQHENLLPFSHGNRLKITLKWADQ